MWFSPFLPPVLGFMKPSGEPVVPGGPQLSPLSPRSSSCFSPVFPWCRPNPFAANRKPECHRHLSKRQLRHGGGCSRLRQPVPHPAVLPVHWVALQQIGASTPTRGRSGSVPVSGQHPEGPEVRRHVLFWLKLVRDAQYSTPPFHFHKTYWKPDSPCVLRWCQRVPTVLITVGCDIYVVLCKVLVQLEHVSLANRRFRIELICHHWWNLAFGLRCTSCHILHAPLQLPQCWDLLKQDMHKLNWDIKT